MNHQNSLLIQDSLVVDPSQNLNQIADIWIENGTIKAIDKPGSFADKKFNQIIRAPGCWTLPGFIDAHVHLREPGQESKETIKAGSQAAIHGGFTTVACMANTTPVNDNANITNYIQQRAKDTAHCRVYPIGAVSKGLKGKELAEIGSMVKAGAVAISDDGMPVMNSLLMRQAMEYAKEFNIPVISHAEDKHLVAGGIMNEGEASYSLGVKGNPAAAEEIMVAREIALCRLTGCHVHIAHVSTKLAIDHIRRAKDEGLPITAEVTPHHLFLTDKKLMNYDTHCKMAPPLRTREDTLALQKALADGTIDILATDHAPHTKTDKQTSLNEASFGVTGLQTAMALTMQLVLSEKVSLNRWTESLTLLPAKILNLPHGTLKKGSLADISIIDPNQTWKFDLKSNVSKNANSPFINYELKGKVIYTLLSGEVVYES